MILGLRKPNPYRALEQKLGYKFDDRKLLETALLHRSYRYETPEVTADNQRLEFLGDAVLGFVTAAHLYRAHREGDEGVLTELRSRVTSGKALAAIALETGLGEFMKLGKGEERAGGRKRDTVLADAFEAVLGAAYLDGGVKAVEKIVAKLLVPLMGGVTSAEDWTDNPKGELQAQSQRMYGRGPEYRCVAEEGPAHQKRFKIEVRVGGALLGQGEGNSKRIAETEAAAAAIRKLSAKASAKA